jgi:hypothetical protein
MPFMDMEGLDGKRRPGRREGGMWAPDVVRKIGERVQSYKEIYGRPPSESLIHQWVRTGFPEIKKPEAPKPPAWAAPGVRMVLMQRIRDVVAGGRRPSQAEIVGWQTELARMAQSSPQVFEAYVERAAGPPEYQYQYGGGRPSPGYSGGGSPAPACY